MTRIFLRSTDSREMVAALPVFGQAVQNFLERWLALGSFCKGECFAPREFQKFAVAQRIGDVKAKVASLTRAEKFSRTTKLQIRFGDFKPVGSANHRFEASASVVCHSTGSDQNAVGLFRAAADAATQLMKLREAETLRVFDDHDGGVRHVHPNFNDCGGHENLDFVFAKALHDFFFFLAGEAAMQQAELEFWKNFLR